MKTLHEYTQRIPLSDSNQPVKADHARVVRQSAEQMLEDEKRGSALMGMYGIDDGDDER